MMVARIDDGREFWLTLLRRGPLLLFTSAATSGTETRNACTDAEYGERGGFRDGCCFDLNVIESGVVGRRKVYALKVGEIQGYRRWPRGS